MHWSRTLLEGRQRVDYEERLNDQAAFFTFKTFTPAPSLAVGQNGLVEQLRSIDIYLNTVCNLSCSTCFLACN
jgi:hypothetical protein